MLWFRDCIFSLPVITNARNLKENGHSILCTTNIKAFCSITMAYSRIQSHNYYIGIYSYVSCVQQSGCKISAQVPRVLLIMHMFVPMIHLVHFRRLPEADWPCPRGGCRKKCFTFVFHFRSIASAFQFCCYSVAFRSTCLVLNSPPLWKSPCLCHKALLCWSRPTSWKYKLAQMHSKTIEQSM